MSELGWLLIAFASTVVAANIAVVVVVRALFKRIRRTLALNGASLRIRARLSTGPRREVLKLRVRLKENIDSGQAAIDLAVRTDGLRGELPRLFRRLKSEGATLEAQLRLLESESDVAVLADVLPAARDRVDQVAHLVRRLRSAVASGLGGISDDSLTMLSSDLDREITAVRAGMQELHELNGRGAFFEPGRRQRTTNNFIQE
jgi:hypothetical protein